MKLQDYAYGIRQLALTPLCDVAGGVALDELLAERERRRGAPAAAAYLPDSVRELRLAG